MINMISLWALPVIIVTILTIALIKKILVYEEFLEGAKDGFTVFVSIISYLVAIIVGLSILKTSGAIDMLSTILAPILHKFMIPVDSLSIMIIRSMSGA